MTDRTDDMCENCILWDGDSRGEQGECFLDPEAPVRTGRFESCVRFIDRNVDTFEEDNWRDSFGDN